MRTTRWPILPLIPLLAAASALAAEPQRVETRAAAASQATATPAAPQAATPQVASPSENLSPAFADRQERLSDPAKLAERDAAYLSFRREFDAGRYTEALPYAETVVALTERYAIDPVQLPSALNNLGATHYKLGDYVAAEQAYAKALALVEQQQGATSKRLLTPLRGLALTYQAGGRKDAAAPLLERAVAISRRADGLFNPDQLDLIEPLIDSYVATGRWLDADQMHQYAFRVNERRYGATGARLVPSLSKLAQWYEQTGRYTQARRTWARMYANATARGQENASGAVNALRGMARTYRLEYQFGPEVIEEQMSPMQPGGLGVQIDASERDPFGRKITGGLSPSDYRLDPQGKEFLEAALEMIRTTDPPSPQAEAVVLIELGDWTALQERDASSSKYYERAWSLLPKGDPGQAEAPKNPLLYPSPILYRPPVSARRLRDQPADLVLERVAIAEFTVTAEGKVKDPQIVEGDANDSQRSQFLSAIGRAVYRPRFVDGKAVATEHVRYRETFREYRSVPPKPAS